MKGLRFKDIEKFALRIAPIIKTIILSFDDIEKFALRITSLTITIHFCYSFLRYILGI